MHDVGCLIYTFTSAASYSIELLLSLFCNNRFRPIGPRSVLKDFAYTL